MVILIKSKMALFVTYGGSLVALPIKNKMAAFVTYLISHKFL